MTGKYLESGQNSFFLTLIYFCVSMCTSVLAQVPPSSRFLIDGHLCTDDRVIDNLPQFFITFVRCSGLKQHRHHDVLEAQFLKVFHGTKVFIGMFQIMGVLEETPLPVFSIFLRHLIPLAFLKWEHNIFPLQWPLLLPLTNKLLSSLLYKDSVITPHPHVSSTKILPFQDP